MVSLISGLVSEQVEALSQDDAGFYDIYGMIHRPWWQHPGWKFFGGTLVLLALIFLVTRFYTKRKKEKRLTPWDQALRDIEHAKQRAVAADLVSQEVGAQFYVELSRILKTYLHERYSFDVLGKTDQELILWAQEKPELAHVHAMLSPMLEGGEYIKFAGRQAARDAVERHALAAQDMVKQTTPSPARPSSKS